MNKKQITIKDSPISELGAYSFSGNPITQLEVTNCYMDSVNQLAFQTKTSSNTTDVNALRNSLIRLSLMRNELTTLTNGTFEGLTSLHFLLLSWNKLTNLDDGLFDHLISLVSINLEVNSLTSISPGVFQVLSIRPNSQPPKFYLEYNNVTCSCDMTWLLEIPSRVDALFPKASCFDRSLHLKSSLNCIVYDRKYCFPLKNCLALKDATTAKSALQESTTSTDDEITTNPILNTITTSSSNSSNNQLTTSSDVTNGDNATTSALSTTPSSTDVVSTLL